MNFFNSQSGNKPDFNYPKDVSATAISDIEKAAKSGNDALLCDALIRYSVAQSLISDINANACLKKIDEYRGKMSGTDYKAIVTLLEANIYSNLKTKCYSTEVHDSFPVNLDEWSKSDFDNRIKLLYDDVFANISQLHKCDIKNYASLINANPDFFPTLLDFAFSQRIDAKLPSDDKKALMQDWLTYHNGDVAPAIYINTYIIDESGFSYKEREEKLLTLYNRYSQFEESGYILTNIPFSAYDNKQSGASRKLDSHNMLNEYLKRFPKSRFSAHIQNQVYEMEKKSVNVKFPHIHSSKSKIPITVTYENVSDYEISIYTLIKTSKSNRHSECKIGKLVRTVTFHLSDTTLLSSGEETQYLDPLPYGLYTIIPSFIADGKRQESNNGNSEIRITDLSAFIVSASDGNHRELYAIDCTNGHPIEGVDVKSKPFTRHTDKNGMADISNKKERVVTISKDNDTCHPEINDYTSYYTLRTTYSSDIITDLAIYRPGETIKYSAIISQHNGDITSPYKKERVDVAFYDASGQLIANDSITTDEFGRVDGEFVVPTDRMNGTFHINISSKKVELSSRKHIEISEYKTPTFSITLNDVHHSYNKAEDVTINGIANTFAGMPVANASVVFTLKKSSWAFWRFRSDSSTVSQDTITTNNKGEFTLTIPKHLFEENAPQGDAKMIANMYSLNVSCTNNTGETQTCNHEFFVGQHRKLDFNDEMTFINQSPITLPVTIESSDPGDKVFTCRYRITKSETDSTIIASGEFSSTNSTIDLTTLSSGKYFITVEDASGLAEKKSGDIILYRETDKECPIESVLWVPVCGRKACDDNNMARITLGTTEQDIHLFYLASTKKTFVKGWKHYAKGIHTLEIPMPTGDNEEIEITLFTMKNGQQRIECFTLIAPKRIVTAKIEAVSFRDKLTPDTKEKWTFRFIDNHGRRLSGAAIIAMTDKAINSIASNIWCNHDPIYKSETPYAKDLITPTSYISVFQQTDWTHRLVKPTYIDTALPTINYYGYPPFGYHRYDMMLCESAVASPRMQGAMYKSNAMLAPSMAPMQADITADYEYGVNSEYSTGNLNDIAMRLSDVKTALWMPNLSTDENGDFTVEFTAPNFNTTWIMQALAFTANGYFGGLQREVVTSRPLMVKANMPRFIRVGDKATLAANVANKTDEPAEFTGIIELFDPRTDKVIASKAINGSLQAMANTAVTIDYTVPQDASFIGFRIKAATNGSGDGEQVMIPVISNLSPVIEASPLYIDAGETKFTAELPKVDNVTKATLEYCDNPVWYCATALPTIFDEDAKTSTSLAHTLFALSVAHGIANDNAQIAEALKYWQKQDSASSPLISALSRNSDLKIRPLLASPWISEADRQTLRMSKLNELFDTDTHAEKIRKVVNALKDLQKKDGGFTWFNYNGCESSLYCTGTVLEVIARIRHLGYTVDDSRIDDILARAVKYYDTEYLKLMKKEKKSSDLTHYGDYAYTRTMYSDIAIPSENAQYIKRIIKDIKNGWSGASLPTKAFYALTLNANGEKQTAKKITESIRQFSITTPQRGMYWDAIERNWWRGDNELSTTTLILQALNEVDHRTNEIDQIRKWILLNKQSNDWSGSSLASEAVYAILATGNSWLVNGEMPEISLGATKIALSDIDRYLGYCRKDIAPELASGVSISIMRGQNTSPAWGAVYMQGKAKSTAIKSAKVDDLSIEKTLLTYNADGTLAKAGTLKVGDKVRVQFSIKCGKSLEYLTLTDERGACFEPADKTSDTDYQNGVWMYREVKDCATNIFIGHLSKGSYVIGYDTYVTNQGEFGVGIATIQCQYSPQITAHSAGSSVIVK